MIRHNQHGALAQRVLGHPGCEHARVRAGAHHEAAAVEADEEGERGRRRRGRGGERGGGDEDVGCEGVGEDGFVGGGEFGEEGEGGEGAGVVLFHFCLWDGYVQWNVYGRDIDWNEVFTGMEGCSRLEWMFEVLLAYFILYTSEDQTKPYKSLLTDGLRVCLMPPGNYREPHPRGIGEVILIFDIQIVIEAKYWSAKPRLPIRIAIPRGFTSVAAQMLKSNLIDRAIPASIYSTLEIHI